MRGAGAGAGGTGGADAAPVIAADETLEVDGGPSISGPGLVTIMDTTSRRLPDGKYVVSWSVVSLHTVAGSVAGVQVLIDGTPVPAATTDGPASTSPATRTSVSASGSIVHVVGTIAVQVKVRRSAEAGNINPQHATVELRKVFS